MSKKILKMVTVTGADDLTDIDELKKVESEFPFVEFGILLSKSSEGRPRFPRAEWINELKFLEFNNLSGHLCGRWVRDVCAGEETFWNERPIIANMFNRIQLNFHAYTHKVEDWKKVFEMLKRNSTKEIIFQLDGVNDQLCQDAKDAGVNAYPFFDVSGGAGILPDEWPKINGWHGMAGGLGVDNLAEELTKMEKVVDEPIWIDAETKLRSGDFFDLNIIKRFLTIASNWVI